MSKAFVMLTAERVEAGPVREVAGALQQETRLFQGDQCVCVLLVTYPPDSPEWVKWAAARTLDGMNKPLDSWSQAQVDAAAEGPL